MVITEVFGSGLSTSVPVVQLAEILEEVRVLIFDGIFYGATGVLTSVATHYPTLDFVDTYRGYASGWSMDKI